MASIGVIQPTTENQYIDADNSMAEYSSSIRDSSDEKHFKPVNDIQSLMPPLELSSAPQDMVVDGLVTSDENVQEPSSYDSCFGVVGIALSSRMARLLTEVDHFRRLESWSRLCQEKQYYICLA